MGINNFSNYKLHKLSYPDQIYWLNWDLNYDNLQNQKIVAFNNFQNYEDGKIVNNHTIRKVINEVCIDADVAKYFYIKLNIESARKMKVFFADGNAFTEKNSFATEIPVGKDFIIFRFDLTSYTLWKSKVNSLCFEFNGCDKKDSVCLCDIGISDRPLMFAENAEFIDIIVEETMFFERMAAWHETMVAVGEIKPNSGIFTYNNDENTELAHYMIAKFVTYLVNNDELIGPDKSRNLLVEDFPGGVAASYYLNNVKVSFDMIPLMVGRDTKEQEGAVLYRLRTEPATPISVHCGDGDKSVMVGWRKVRRNKELVDLLLVIPRTQMAENEFTNTSDNVLVENGIAVLSGNRQPHVAVVKSGGAMFEKTGENGGSYLEVLFENGSGDILLAFSKDAEKAKKIIAGIDANKEFIGVQDYYSKLLECSIETPEKDIDAAFQSAVYNLEYNWLQPFGWSECIHHWFSMWHMQHTLGTDWLGQADRSKMCIVSQAERLYENGAVPMLYSNGNNYRAWGGTNQFFAWQVRHYWNHTADRDFIEYIAPIMDSVIAQTYEEYDSDGDLMLAWKEQIGNQEDYVSHPDDSSAPSIEGINMMKTRVIIAKALNDFETVERYEFMIAKAIANLRANLWKDDLGRFMYYKDALGIEHLDGQYQTYIYPAIYEVVDSLDAWTGMRHLRDRLTGNNGEIYCSNNFPNHITATLGTQAAAAQQPWGAMGLACVGLRNEAYLPLKEIASNVMNDRCRGSWPENATEPSPSYFSPPAAVYVQGTIEAIFGLTTNVPENYIRISPSFPDHWSFARLNLPDYSSEYFRDGNTLFYTVRSARELSQKVRWLLPVCKICEVTVDEKEIEYEVLPSIGSIMLSVDISQCRSSRLKIKIKPVLYNVQCPASIAEGDKLQLEINEAKILKIDDRCKVLREVSIGSGTKLNGVINNKIVTPYLKYGRLGLLNFSRRTFFIYCVTEDGYEFWHPVDLTILPRYEAAPCDEVKGDCSKGKIEIIIRNNTFEPLNGNGIINIAGGYIHFDVSIPSRNESKSSITLPENLLLSLLPGDNTCCITLPGGDKVDLIIVASEIFKCVSFFQNILINKLISVTLPQDALINDSEWKNIRMFRNQKYMPWVNVSELLKDLPESSIKVPEFPFEFKISGHKFIPMSWRSEQTYFKLNLEEKKYRKLYLLVVPLLDNHDMFAPVCRIILSRNDDQLIARTLYFPGNLDWFWPDEAVGNFATVKGMRKNRYGLLPLLGEKEEDWVIGKPVRNSWDLFETRPVQGFPQPEFWSSSLVFKTRSSVMNVIEVDLLQPTVLKYLTISPIGVEPAFGLVAVSAVVDK